MQFNLGETVRPPYVGTRYIASADYSDAMYGVPT